MRPAARDIVVTGLGAVCAVGHDCDELLSSIEIGRSGIRRITRFDTDEFRVHIGAEVRDWRTPSSDSSEAASELCRGFSVRAAREALLRAGIDPDSGNQRRIGFAFGTGLVDGLDPVHDLATSIADEIGAHGPRLTVSTACSSSTGAIGVARDLLSIGACDVVLAGGSDVLTASVFAGFHALGALSDQHCAPFSLPFGTTLGEGAGFLVIERADAAESRGAPSLARLSGYGLSADAHHETSPDPDGQGVTRAVRGALADAGLDPEDVDYVNAHGSGTEANDPSEWRGIRRGLGDAEDVPVSSTKGALGHTQGAAGVLESIVTILGMNRDFIAPTINYVGPRRFAPPDPVGGQTPRPTSVGTALCLNSAFGGANAALLFSGIDSHQRGAAVRRPVVVRGLGLVGPRGLGLDETGRVGPPLPGRVPPFEIERLLPRTDPRGLDPSSRYLMAASVLACQDAGVRVTGSLRNRTGLIAGALRPSPQSVAAFGDSIAERGLSGLSAAAFARIVLNAPAGFCAKAIGLRGPHTALSAGEGSGLAAIIVAAEVLSTRPEVELMFGASVDEIAEGTESSDKTTEGSVSVLLGAGLTSESSVQPAIRLLGWGVAGPGEQDRAIEVARSMEGVGEDGYDEVFDTGDYSVHQASDLAVPSALAFTDAVLSLRRGVITRALVTSGVGRSITLAVILGADTRAASA